MSDQALRTSTRKDLAAIAREHQVSGWHGMRKEELIEALMDVFDTSSRNRLPATKSPRPAAAAVSKNSPKGGETAKSGPAGSTATAAREAASVCETNPARDPRPAPAAKAAASAAAPEPKTGQPPAKEQARDHAGAAHDPLKDPRKDLSTVGSGASVSEELDAVAHDPNWLHVRWVLKRCTVARAAAGLGSEWHRAVPILRVFRVHTHETKSTSETLLRDVEIHGETDHWFVPVDTPPCAFKLQIGFRAGDGTFFPLAKSRRVTTPRPGSKAAERTRLARPAPGPAKTNVPAGAPIGAPSRPASVDPLFEKFKSLRADYAGAAYGLSDDGRAQAFRVETELLIRGTAHPDSQVRLSGDSVRVGRDGRFAVKMHLGDGRHVIPATCLAPDRQSEQTTVLAFARQSKVLPPQPAGAAAAAANV